MADVAVEQHLGHTEFEPSLFQTYSNKIGMWLFILSDAITFSAMLIAYAYTRVATPDWPRPFAGESIMNATVMTVVLLSSSLTMVLAVRAGHLKLRGSAVKWLLATALGGVIFDILHIREWLGLIHEGVKLFTNPWGTPMFGAMGIDEYNLTNPLLGFMLSVLRGTSSSMPRFAMASGLRSTTSFRGLMMANGSEITFRSRLPIRSGRRSSRTIG